MHISGSLHYVTVNSLFLSAHIGKCSGDKYFQNCGKILIVVSHNFNPSKLASAHSTVVNYQQVTTCQAPLCVNAF